MHWFSLRSASCTALVSNRGAKLRRPLRLSSWAFLSCILCFAAGCHSAYVNATVSNHAKSAITLIQIDYPSASFGTQSVEAGQDFHYRFKILGSGPIKLSYTDVHQVDHQSTGPILHEGNEGSLVVRVTEDGVQWQSSLK